MALGGNSGFTVLNEDAEMYSVIRPAEVCSIETAKQLGLFDKNNYFKGAEGNTVRTFSSKPNDASRPYHLCTENVDDGTAKPLCSLIAPGLIPQKGGGCGRPEGECPPTFKWDAKTKSCKKPIQAVKQPRHTHCEQQWHDWFTVPNSHFKNGFEMVDKKCFAPCPASTLPIRGTDPVQGDNRGADDLKRCVDKVEYMGGKYGDEPDFCNLAWIKRLSVKMPDLETEYVSKFPNFALTGSDAISLATKEGVADIVKATMRAPENISIHPEITEGVCSKEIDTPERLTEAYGICQNILRNPSQSEGKYIEDMTRTLKMVNNNLSPAALRKDILKRYKLLKQACHYTFCDKVDSQRASAIGKPPLCFPASDIQRLDLQENDPLSSKLGAGPGDYPEQYLEEAPTTIDKKIVQRSIRKIANGLLYLALIVCIVLGIYFIVTGIIDFIFGIPNLSSIMAAASAVAGETNLQNAKQHMENLAALKNKLSK